MADSAAKKYSALLGSLYNDFSGPNEFDDFQLLLFGLIDKASNDCIQQFVRNKSSMLYRLTLNLLVASYHPNHPSRVEFFNEMKENFSNDINRNNKSNNTLQLPNSGTGTKDQSGSLTPSISVDSGNDMDLETDDGDIMSGISNNNTNDNDNDNDPFLSPKQIPNVSGNEIIDNILSDNEDDDNETTNSNKSSKTKNKNKNKNKSNNNSNSSANDNTDNASDNSNNNTTATDNNSNDDNNNDNKQQKKDAETGDGAKDEDVTSTPLAAMSISRDRLDFANDAPNMKEQKIIEEWTRLLTHLDPLVTMDKSDVDSPVLVPSCMLSCIYVVFFFSILFF